MSRDSRRNKSGGKGRKYGGSRRCSRCGDDCACIRGDNRTADSSGGPGGSNSSSTLPPTDVDHILCSCRVNEELQRLKRFYSSSFRLVHGNNSTPIVASFDHVCSDPDFDSARLPNGLHCQIMFPSSSHDSSHGGRGIDDIEHECNEDTSGNGVGPIEKPPTCVMNSKPADCSTRSNNTSAPESPSVVNCAEASGRLPFLVLVNTDIPDIVTNAIPALFEETVRLYAQSTARRGRVVFDAMKKIDKNIRELFAIADLRTVTVDRMEWTPEEQKKLEDALVWYRRVADPISRWKLIGKFVGSRSAKECCQRYKQIRQNLTAADTPAASDPKSEQEGQAQETVSCADYDDDAGEKNTEAEDVDEEDNGEVRGQVGPSETMVGIRVFLDQLELLAIDVAYITAPRFQVACGRCYTNVVVRVCFPKEGNPLQLTGVGTTCSCCGLRLTVKAQAQFLHQASAAVCTVECLQCALRDLLPSDYAAICRSCNATVYLKEIANGSRREAICRHCHTRLTFGFSSPICSASGDTKPTATTSGGGADVQRLEYILKGLTASDDTGVRKKRDKKPAGLVLKVGEPLADNGSCKHYKKSYRWLRFPCCGQAFPCDVCHDSATDHPNEWASRMICGFCSKEQPYTAKKPECSLCQHGLTRDSSTHWEGGKGCRDGTKMSRKDNKKYRLMAKQSEERRLKSPSHKK
eukprot:GHVS01010189.1.p1 GENE.GHVS01010189.1~~GHVS01010189.1.p1  ORF type:complete len:692 (+),score=58.94 GHVS01010189.1:1-2076(+)